MLPEHSHKTRQIVCHRRTIISTQLDVNGFRHLLPRGSWETFYDKIIHDKPAGVNRNMYNEHKVRPLL